MVISEYGTWTLTKILKREIKCSTKSADWSIIGITTICPKYPRNHCNEWRRKGNAKKGHKRWKDSINSFQRKKCPVRNIEKLGKVRKYTRQRSNKSVERDLGYYSEFKNWRRFESCDERQKVRRGRGRNKAMQKFVTPPKIVASPFEQAEEENHCSLNNQERLSV